MQNHKQIEFTKMHSLGNDFIVINNISNALNIQNIPITTLSNRYTGIGFDQLIYLETSEKADISCRFFNADGSEAEQCGNGTRALARYVHENKIITKNTFSIETAASIVDVTIHDYEHIQAALGIPAFGKNISLNINEKNYDLLSVSMGNPHVILLVENLESFPLENIGKQISTHTIFPKGVNVGFMKIISRQKIQLRTYERGVGKTYACGSNACAAVAAGIKHGFLDDSVTIELELGSLDISWKGEGSHVVMTGPAECVFTGKTK